jgi:hypothetical protein
VEAEEAEMEDVDAEVVVMAAEVSCCFSKTKTCSIRAASHNIPLLECKLSQSAASITVLWFSSRQ